MLNFYLEFVLICVCVCYNIFSLLFSLYSKIILTELVSLPGFIIKGHNLNNIHCRGHCFNGRFTRKIERTIKHGSQRKQEEKYDH